jgi:3-deoxy-D-arabino-heptulosonate 7-phosphate (DAHP) synthase
MKTTLLILCGMVILLTGCGTIKVPTNTLTFKTPFGALNIEHPQDFVGSNLDVFIGTNGSVHATFGYIKTANSPEVIDKVAAGQAAVITAQGNALKQAFEAGGAMAGNFAGAAAKTMIKP